MTAVSVRVCVSHCEDSGLRVTGELWVFEGIHTVVSVWKVDSLECDDGIHM